MVACLGTFLLLADPLVSLSGSWGNRTILVKASSRGYFSDYSYGNLADDAGSPSILKEIDEQRCGQLSSLLCGCMRYDYDP